LSKLNLESRAEPHRLIQAATYLWAILLIIVCIKLNYYFFYDDGFITLRYARHLAEGHGPVWNLVGPPVEGFTSPLHVLIVAAFLAIHIKWLLALRIISFGFHAALAIFTWRFVSLRSGNLAASLAVALVTASWPLLVWDLGGLETVPFTALLAIGTLLTLRYAESRLRRDVLWGGVLLGLACFMRLDAILVAITALAVLLVDREIWTKRRIADVSLAIAAFVVVTAPWEVFRLEYFHAALPNTYYAKVYGIPFAWRAFHGFAYAKNFVLKPPYLIPFLLAVIVVAVVSRKWTRFDLSLLLCILSYSFYIIDSGGDHMAAYRFMVPLIPLIAILLIILWKEVGGLRSTTFAAATTCVLLSVSLIQARHSDGYTPLNPRWRDPAGMIGEEVGVYIDKQWKPGSTVALKVAGSTPFFADNLTYIDLLGLNDAVIARRNPLPMKGYWDPLVGHLKGDAHYVMKQRPDYVILGIPQGELVSSLGRATFAEYELTHLAAFAADYKPCEQTITLSAFASSQMAHSKDKTVNSIYYQRRDLPYPCKTPAVPSG
jgi:arabinofuranosyltransferase